MVNKRDVAMLLAIFRQADFFSLKDKYEMGASDLETVEISLTLDGHTKR